MVQTVHHSRVQPSKWLSALWGEGCTRSGGSGHIRVFCWAEHPTGKPYPLRWFSLCGLSSEGGRKSLLYGMCLHTRDQVLLFP